jgi:hypothetical protein
MSAQFIYRAIGGTCSENRLNQQINRETFTSRDGCFVTCNGLNLRRIGEQVNISPLERRAGKSTK